MAAISKIDIRENILRTKGRVLDILLSDKTTGKNIIWATDSYMEPGKEYRAYAPKKQILSEQITGLNGKKIQPRASKSREEQIKRTKDKAEVFTPLDVVNKMNLQVARKLTSRPNHTWFDFVKSTWLEITCGEGPFIAGRYNPTTTRQTIVSVDKRVGFLDRKLQIISKHTNDKEDWLYHAEIALKACYGYEWQGDNLLIARENILLTLDDYYKDFCANKLKLKSRRSLTVAQFEKYAEIISWNIFQMDGLKYVVPLSCKSKIDKSKQQLTFIEPEPIIIEKPQCEGCKNNDPFTHTPKSKYVKIMDWSTGKQIRFVDLLCQSNNLNLVIERQ